MHFEAGTELITEDPKMSLIPSKYLSFNNQKGLHAKYYNNHEFTGTPVATRIEDVVNSNWNLKPVNGLNEAKFGVEYTGTIKVDVSGEYDLGLQSHHRVFILEIDGKVVADNSNRPKRKVIMGSV